MSSPKSWFRGAPLIALLLSVATPGCLADGDDVDLDDSIAMDDQALDPGVTYDITDEPSLELMAEGTYAVSVAVKDAGPDNRRGVPEVGADPAGEEGENDGEPTPQPWHSEVTDDPGEEEGGPDPVPWEVAGLGPDPVPWHTDDDLKSAAGNETNREFFDPN